MYNVQTTGSNDMSNFRTRLFSVALHSGCSMAISSGVLVGGRGDSGTNVPFSTVSTETSLLAKLILPIPSVSSPYRRLCNLSQLRRTMGRRKGQVDECPLLEYTVLCTRTSSQEAYTAHPLQSQTVVFVPVLYPTFSQIQILKTTWNSSARLPKQATTSREKAKSR